MLYNCLSRYKFVNTHLYHSRQLYNIHIIVNVGRISAFAQHKTMIKLQIHTKPTIISKTKFK